MELQNPWMLAVYIVAMLAICWHFSYGVWLFAAKWGITPGKTARKRFGLACAAMGLLLVVMGLASIWAFVGPKYRDQGSEIRDQGLLVGKPVILERVDILQCFCASDLDTDAECG
jgi:succinate dehydrogenase / fumarate reductase cytochrome b subunit